MVKKNSVHYVINLNNLFPLFSFIRMCIVYTVYFVEGDQLVI